MAIMKDVIKGLYDPLLDRCVDRRVTAAFSEAEMRLAQVEQAKRRADYASHAADALKYGTPVSARYSPIQMITMRMRIREGDILPFQHLSMYEAQNKVFVFVVAKDQPTIIEDDPTLFPSDTLIAALHLLKG